MKHGPFAMIDKNFPAFALACSSELLEKISSNMQEIENRKGKMITVVNEKLRRNY